MVVCQKQSQGEKQYMTKQQIQIKRNSITMQIRQLSTYLAYMRCHFCMWIEDIYRGSHTQLHQTGTGRRGRKSHRCLSLEHTHTNTDRWECHKSTDPCQQNLHLKSLNANLLYKPFKINSSISNPLKFKEYKYFYIIPNYSNVDMQKMNVKYEVKLSFILFSENLIGSL